MQPLWGRCTCAADHGHLRPHAQSKPSFRSGAPATDPRRSHQRESGMITFINHACFIVESGGVKLLCDPWIAGSAFHDGWNLITEEEHPGIHDVDYIWYSHEHPDHFSIPFLKSVPQEKRGNITVLYQRTNDHRVLDFCRKQGFKTMELEQAERVSLGGGMHVTCGMVPFYDSWMLIETQDLTILNVNDCILETPERLQTIKRSEETTSELKSLMRTSYAVFCLKKTKNNK